MNTLLIDEKEILHVLQEMIKIESVNPSLSSTGSGENKIAAYIGSYLSQLGLEVKCQEIGQGRLNTIAILRGTGGGKTLMLNGHTDTVSIGEMSIEPLGAEYRDGKVYGRGAIDMKGGLASMIGAVKALIDSGVRTKGDIILAFVADEEYTSLGTEKLVKEYSADGGIVCEPTDLKICMAHKGFAWIKVEVFGKSAHGSKPAEGIDAIVKAGKVLVGIDELGRNVLANRRHPLLGSPSIHASLIKGGTELSTYPDYCSIEIERRTIPGESKEMVIEEMKMLMDSLSYEDEQFKSSFDVFFYRSSLEVHEDDYIVKSLETACIKEFSQNPGYMGMSGWLDSAIMTDAGIPTVIFGPSGHGLHAAVEYVDFQSVVAAARVLAGTIIDFCGI